VDHSIVRLAVEKHIIELLGGVPFFRHHNLLESVSELRNFVLYLFQLHACNLLLIIDHFANIKNLDFHLLEIDFFFYIASIIRVFDAFFKQS
jgi:hypothetical protein